MTGSAKQSRATRATLDCFVALLLAMTEGPISPGNEVESQMQFDTKIAVVIRTDLEAWQKLNVASFLAGGIAAAFPGCIGEAYEDSSGTKYLALIGQPILIYGADRPA